MAQLKRTLGFLGVFGLAMSAVLGTGSFFGAHIGAVAAGQAALVSWILVFIISMSIAGIFAELSGMFSDGGGIYEYAKKTYGRSISFIVGWSAWLMGNISIVLLIIAGIMYLMPQETPQWTMILIASIVVLVFNIIAALGIETSSKFMLFLSGLLFSSLIALLIASISGVDITNILPLNPFPIEAMLLAAFLLIESFFGWEAATYLSEETKNPKKTIPKVILTATFLVGIIVIAIVYVTYGIFGAEALQDIGAPVTALAAEIFHGNAQLISLITFIVAFSMFADSASSVVTMPRLLYSMAKDKLFLHHFSKVHPITRVPLNATIFQTVVSLSIIQLAFGNYIFLLQMILPIGLLIYFLMALAIPIHRYRNPDMERTFRFPLGKFLPVILGIIFAYLVYNWTMTAENAFNLLLFSVSLIMLAIPVYLLLELYYDPKFIIKFNEALYPVLSITNYDPRIRKEMHVFLDDLNGSIVVEIGGGSGRLSEELLEMVGPDGTLIATSFSSKQLRHLRHKLEKKTKKGGEWGRAILIRDKEQLSRMPPQVKNVDAIISYGFLSYIQDIDEFLEDASKSMKPGAKVVFADYINHFHIIPDPEFLSDIETIELTFKKHGYGVRVKKYYGLISNRIVIYGVYGYGSIPFI
ncbi:MAG: amino acid permease [Candidatus Woesearchaeota archaeon]